MNFKNIIETINYELVIEGIGALFGIALLWKFLFQNGLQELLSLFLITVC